jgi:anti-anti-sigma factor
VLVAVVITTLISAFTGFQHDTKTSVSAIMSPEAQQLIKDYNQTIKDGDALSLKRTEITSSLSEAKKTERANSITLLNIEHELAVTNAEISELSEKALRAREELRLTLFTAASDSQGTVRFYPQGKVPAGMKASGETWRLKVGTGALKEDALTMTGGGSVVGAIPQGLPAFSLPPLRISDLVMLLPNAVIISLLGFVEAISIAKAMAAKTGQFLDPNQELIGQGLANIFGAIGQSYPTSGSFSRSAVNLQAGAFSGLSSVVKSLTVVVLLMFLTPLLYALPQATLAAVIMMAVFSLIHPTSFIHAWQTHRVDGAICCITFLATLYFAPEMGAAIIVGVVLSLGVFIYNSMKPRVAHLALHPDQSYRDAEHWGLDECRHIAMIRYDGNLFFANASYFERLVMDRVSRMPELKHILLVANGINDMDASGEDVLSLIVDNVRSAGIDFSVSGLKESVLEMMKRTHLYEKIGEDHIFATQAIAIQNIFDRAHKGTDEERCPLLIVTYREKRKAKAALASETRFA